MICGRSRLHSPDPSSTIPDETEVEELMDNAERRLPFYGQIVKMTELGESDDLFKLFNY